MKISKGIAVAALAATSMLLAPDAQAIGWPAGYEGVMLQGFYWDSYKETSWKALTGMADELSQYFSLIWVPNSARADSDYTMGYHPVYWFTNHNSTFGSEEELRTMISTYKEKGTGIIADVVINHRNGRTNWTDFPSETWEGTTYKIGPEGICCDDEVKDAKGQATPTGAYDTGEGWSGARDLDHTNANVQKNCKAYIKCLLTDFGYAGVRYDFVKGYSPEYTKMYNEANKVEYSVGEYWDGNYDLVKNWIEGTGKTSAAFDFPFKYQLNKAFNGGSENYGELVWKANGTTDQPAGMIHFGYPQYAVTFIDNHDTYGDGSKYTGDVMKAYAFMLSCPGTPCVFYPHYKQNKAAMQALIKARKDAGISNTSSVNVLESGSCYVAEVTGSKGKLWIKLGNSSKTAGNGFTKKASGSGYEVWTNVSGTPAPRPEGPVKIYFKNDKGWATPYIYYWGASAPEWPGVPMAKDGSVWSYTCPEGTTGVIFNAGDGDATKTADMEAVNNHIYSTSGDEGEYGSTPDPGNLPEKLYVMGDLENSHWDTTEGVVMERNGKVYSAKVTFAPNEDQTYAYFNIATTLGADWDSVNSGDRYGASEEGVVVDLKTDAPIVAYIAGVNASSCKSWMVLPGTYTVKADLDANKLSLLNPSGVEVIATSLSEENAQYFTLQGVRVANPVSGIYIRVTPQGSCKVRL